MNRVLIDVGRPARAPAGLCTLAERHQTGWWDLCLSEQIRGMGILEETGEINHASVGH